MQPQALACAGPPLNGPPPKDFRQLLIAPSRRKLIPGREGAGAIDKPMEKVIGSFRFFRRTACLLSSL